MINQNSIKIATDNWMRAANSLGFRLIIPYKYSIHNKKKEAFTYLPDYGSRNGTIVGLICAPDFEVDKDLIEWAKVKECHYSFINIDDYMQYDDQVFKETLDDWSI